MCQPTAFHRHLAIAVGALLAFSALAALPGDAIARDITVEWDDTTGAGIDVDGFRIYLRTGSGSFGDWDGEVAYSAAANDSSKETDTSSL